MLATMAQELIAAEARALHGAGDCHREGSGAGAGSGQLMLLDDGRPSYTT